MTGVLYNCAFIVLGALLGRILRRAMNERITEALLSVLGLCTLVIGIRISLRMENILLVLGCLIVGGGFGTAFQLENVLERWLVALQNRWAQTFSRPSGGTKHEVTQVLLNTSVLFCTGAMAILGPIESALRHDHEILITKGILDGTFTLTLAAVYGPILSLTAIPVLFYQGLIAVFASQLEYLNQPSTLNNLSGVGGILLIMIGLSVSKIKTFKVADFLPSLFLYLLYTGLLAHFA